MEQITQVILSLLGLLGIGSIITVLLNKAKEIEFQKLEQKQRRYKSILLYMDAYLKPENIKYISSRLSDINSGEDIIEYLIAEYHEMVLYGSKKVIITTKKFIENPNNENFLTVIINMRKDLWIKKYDLNIEEIEIINIKKK